MANQRNLERQHKRLQVLYGPDRAISIGFTQDISVNGLFIQATVIFAPKTKLQVVLLDPARGEIRFVARVAWAKKVHPGMVRKVKGGMGLMIEQFSEGEALYQALLPGEAKDLVGVDELVQRERLL